MIAAFACPIFDQYRRIAGLLAPNLLSVGGAFWMMMSLGWEERDAGLQQGLLDFLPHRKVHHLVSGWDGSLKQRHFIHKC